MSTNGTQVPGWKLDRVAEGIRERAKHVMIGGVVVVTAGAAGAVASYASSAQAVLFPLTLLAVVVGGGVWLRGLRTWQTADARAERELSAEG